MVNIFRKIDVQDSSQFSMPLGLRIIKESATAGIDWKCLHIIDLFSIIYSIRIDNAKQYLKQQRQEKWAKRGIKEVKKANAQDFDNL